MTLESPVTPPLLTTDLAGIGGHIKTQPEDFEVEEVPAYQPCGQGEFLYLWVEKRGLGAEYFLRTVARRLEIPADQVGAAGLKDRHAVTRQWLSVPASVEPSLSRLDGDGIRLLDVGRHGNKLKPGHLRGNHFRILVRQPVADATDRLVLLVERIRTLGLPNFYGSQRFGRDGETLRLGLDLLAGRDRKLSAFLRRLALSAAQSALFNHHVAARMADGVLRQVLEGDVMMKWPYGGMFVATDLETEQSRLQAREIIPGGPMFGKKMFPAAGEAARREQRTLEEAGLDLAAFRGFGKLLSGTRRYVFVYVDDLQAEGTEEGVRLSFTLPAGSYATVLLRELTHSDGVDAEEGE